MWLKLTQQFIFFYVVLIKSTLSEEQKWTWGAGKREEVREAASRQAKEYLEARSPLQRYEIYENLGPAPLGNYPRPPGGFGRPPSSHYGGILAGPINQGPITEINKCRCTEKFNCPSSALVYGQCDVGKKYCCEGAPGPISSKPVHSIENGVLSGPGGPVDGPYGQGGFYGSNGGYGQGGAPHPGVLVGPGGPTGVVGRPQGYGQGVLVGPGGPGGPSGFINRPNYPQNQYNPGVLVGPGGPTGIVERPQNQYGELVSTIGNILGYLGGYQGGPINNYGYGRSAPSSRNDKSIKNDPKE